MAAVRNQGAGDIGDYRDAVSDYLPQIEAAVARLRRAPEDGEAVAGLFRLLHNLKGDAALCKVDIGVRLMHPLESLLDNVRNGRLRFTPMLGEVVLLVADRLELAVAALADGRSQAALQLDTLTTELVALARVSPARLEQAARSLIYKVTGFWPVVSAPLPPVPAQPAAAGQQEQARQLEFFRTLAEQLEQRSPLYAGRTGRIVQLARDTNREAGEPVDALQLEAALYMHDIGMMFLPDSAWLKPGQLTEADRAVLHRHPEFAAGLLACMNGWQDAAQMVLQHHEQADGSGYPAGLKLPDICSGARLIAVVDAFEAVMLKHAQRGHGRSMLRAIAEINACEQQFAREWVEPFNRVIRRLLESEAG